MHRWKTSQEEILFAENDQLRITHSQPHPYRRASPPLRTI